MGTCAGAWYFRLRVVRRWLGFVGRGLGPVISACSMLGLGLVGAPVGPLSVLAKSSNDLTRPMYADDSSFHDRVRGFALGLRLPPATQLLVSRVTGKVVWRGCPSA